MDTYSMYVYIRAANILKHHPFSCDYVMYSLSVVILELPLSHLSKSSYLFAQNYAHSHAFVPQLVSLHAKKNPFKSSARCLFSSAIKSTSLHQSGERASDYRIRGGECHLWRTQTYQFSGTNHSQSLVCSHI